MFRRTATLAAANAFAVPSVANAWGQTGHREIAQEHINGRTRAEIELILGEEDLAQASI